MISIWLSPQELDYCRDMAKLAEIGGKSSIRKDKEARKETLTADQLVGQIGQYALAMYLFGEPSRYYIQRLSANLNPNIGDNGQDFLGSNVDVKTSIMRNSQDVFNYRLAIRPNERHKGHVYYLALVEPNGEGTLNMKDKLLVHVVGWVADEHLPPIPNGTGVFDGAFVVVSEDLNDAAPIKWDWRKYK